MPENRVVPDKYSAKDFTESEIFTRALFLLTQVAQVFYL